MKFRSFLAMLLCFVIVVGLLPWEANAASLSVVDFGTCGNSASNITWTLYTDGTLVLSGRGATADWAASGYEPLLEPWLKYEDIIKTVIVEEGIIRIGDYAFSQCTNLTEVSLPSTLVSIGEGAFYACTSLESIVFPPGVMDMEKGILSGCTSLTQVSLPKNITYVPATLLRGCTSMTSFEIPNSVETICGGAFSNSGIKSIDIPTSVKTIESRAFEQCYNLESIVIPESVTSIGNNAFSSCANLTSITLPETLLEMSYGIFEHCSSLKSVVIPSSVVKMNRTFEYAYGLETITFLGHAPVMGTHLFMGVTATVYYPENLASWTEDVRQDYGGDITWVGYSSSISPDPVMASGTCGENLTWKLTHNGTLIVSGTGPMQFATLEAPWKEFMTKISAVEIQDGVTSIAMWAFNDYRNIKTVSIANTVTSIGQSSFFRCIGLTDLVIPEGVTTIYSSAFSNCTGLKTVTIADSVTSIGNNAFSGCTALQIVKLSNSLTEIASHTFNGASLSEITIPQSVTKISFSAFAKNDFSVVYIPANVAVLEGSFADCNKLQSVYFEGDAPTFRYDTFSGVTATVYYPANNDTWTDQVRQNYGGNITWIEMCETHNTQFTVTKPSCTEPGAITHTCTTCGLSYDEILPAAHTYTNDQDTICDVCTCVRHVEAEYPENPPVVHMFRLYDPNSGEHFYTGSTEERDFLVSVGWNYEGVGFSFPVVGAPVYRLYDPVYGEHMYTMDLDEVNSLILAGWNNEGIAFNSAPETEVPQFRLHNPNEIRGAYHFTSSTEERDNLLAAGWEYQGIGWYSCWK